MDAAEMLFRMIAATVVIIALGILAWFTLIGVVEPMYAAFGDPPSDLSWGSPATDALGAFVAGVLGLIVLVVVWFIVAPIQSDVRQQFD